MEEITKEDKEYFENIRQMFIGGEEGTGKSTCAMLQFARETGSDSYEIKKFHEHLFREHLVTRRHTNLVHFQSVPHIFDNLDLIWIKRRVKFCQYLKQKTDLVNSKYSRGEIINFLIECRQERDKLKKELKETKSEMTTKVDRNYKIVKKCLKELRKENGK